MNPQIAKAQRLYLKDAYCFDNEAEVVAVDGQKVYLSRSCFYPGGGGQPADIGTVFWGDGSSNAVLAQKSSGGPGLVHCLSGSVPGIAPGHCCSLKLDGERRLGLMRYHTALHVFNAVMMREFGAWITGVGMAPDHSHIDFKIDEYSDALRERAEKLVNEVLSRDLAIRAYWISETEYRSRSELRRTLDVEPPIENGQIRVIEIDGFDVQACGGTHVHSTKEVGGLKISKVKSKGRANRRFHVLLQNCL